jgi:type I restriction enzyme S subunit
MGDRLHKDPSLTTVKIRDLVKRIRKPVNVQPDEMYREIGIYSHGKGIFYKKERSGASLGNKSVFWVEPNCFVVNIVFAWEQAIAKTTSAEQGMIASHRFPMYKPIAGQTDLDYLVYFFNTLRGKHLLGLASPGGAGRNKTLGQAAFLDLSIPIPSFSEQRRIAEILGAWDNAITLTGRLIAARQRRKKALMQQLLTGKVRFGGFVGEWEEFRLEEVTEILLSNVDKKFDPEETTVRLCNYMDVHSNFYITNDLPFTCGSANEREINKFSLFKGDVIITKDSETPDDIANAAVVSEDLESTVCGYHLAILRPQKERIDGTFLMHHLHHPTINNQFARLANGVTRFGLTTDSIKHAKVKLPSIDEQRRIAAVLQTCDGEIALLEQKLSALKRQKQGLMQQLLSGKVRV